MSCKPAWDLGKKGGVRLAHHSIVIFPSVSDQNWFLTRSHEPSWINKIDNQQSQNPKSSLLTNWVFKDIHIKESTFSTETKQEKRESKSWTKIEIMSHRENSSPVSDDELINTSPTSSHHREIRGELVHMLEGADAMEWMDGINLCGFVK